MGDCGIASQPANLTIPPQVTQIKILENRRFAYIGFHTDRAAAAAKRYLHDTYIDTSKIEVSVPLDSVAASAKA